jgi:hypothetical protein
MPTKSRLFNLVWNCAKVPNITLAERLERRKAEGTHYANGRVVLDTGESYETMSDMEDRLRGYGAMSLVYQDEDDGEDIVLNDVSKESSRIPARSRR